MKKTKIDAFCFFESLSLHHLPTPLVKKMLLIKVWCGECSSSDCRTIEGHPGGSHRKFECVSMRFQVFKGFMVVLFWKLYCCKAVIAPTRAKEGLVFILNYHKLSELSRANANIGFMNVVFVNSLQRIWLKNHLHKNNSTDGFKCFTCDFTLLHGKINYRRK